MGYENEITFIAGLDLGQANDYTAFVVLERQEYDERGKKATYKIRYLERWRGVPYTEQVQRVASILGDPAIKKNVALVVDKTGVGRAVYDMFGDATNCGVWGYTITAGNVPTTSEGRENLTVPKKDLIAIVQAIGGTDRLKLPRSLPYSDILAREILTFEQSQNDAGRVSFNAREGEHDDMLLALSLALWWGENCGRPRIMAW